MRPSARKRARPSPRWDLSRARSERAHDGWHNCGNFESGETIARFGDSVRRDFALTCAANHETPFSSSRWRCALFPRSGCAPPKPCRSPANGASRSTATTSARTKTGSPKICRKNPIARHPCRRRVTATTSAPTRRGCSRLAMRGGKSSRRACATIFPSRATWKCRSCRSRRSIISARRGISATLKFRRTGSGKHFTLFLERAHWQSKVWVDDQEFPANDSLVAPHITDLGVLTPGKHRLSIRVDNRLQLPARGHLVDSHSISDATRRGVERHRGEN